MQSRPSLPSAANTTQPLPVSMSLSKIPSVGKRRHFGHAKDKVKIPRLVTWGIPKSSSKSILSIPRGKARTHLKSNGLCGKIRLMSDMNECDILEEIRSTFKDAMGHNPNFHIQFLQTGGGGSKSLSVPSVSSSFSWTAKEVAKLSGQGCLYVQALADLLLPLATSNEVDLTGNDTDKV